MEERNEGAVEGASPLSPLIPSATLATGGRGVCVGGTRLSVSDDHGEGVGGGVGRPGHQSSAARSGRTSPDTAPASAVPHSCPARRARLHPVTMGAVARARVRGRDCGGGDTMGMACMRRRGCTWLKVRVSSTRGSPAMSRAA
jgi:hypothetical protein